MKIKLLLITFAFLGILGCSKHSGKGAAGSGTKDLASDIDTVSYSLGADIANNLMKNGMTELNAEAFIDGLVSTLNNDTANLKVKLNDCRPKIQAYFTKLQDIKNEKNKKDGEAFLAENKKKEGIKLTESGVQYIVLKEGNGPVPSDTANVKVHYVGSLIDGTVFESSIERGQPAEFPVNRVIKGWQDVLKIMPVGSKWKVFIPQDLAYGANVRPGSKIEPYMALVFEMELLEILPPTEKSKTGLKKPIKMHQ